MDDARTGAQTAGGGEPSTAHLIAQVSEQVSTLVRDELRLAGLEMTRKAKRTGIGVGMLGGSGLIALYGAACLVAAAILGLSVAVAAWLAALIVGVALCAAAGIAALAGRGQLRRATPPVPEQAITSTKADLEQIRESAKR
jgi:Putative Actinobacterial Holin-X, holin superfamily III